ncbi:MAG: NAD-glutamate dehydrogenase domain-containing protein, partial [Pseudomonadales bacterium]
NLGMTQLGRIEYNLHGGICFTDFIDNAGGVNCSDAEVNIKILLNQLLEKKQITVDQRKKLLRQMTDEVAEIVLDNNYHQAQAINLMGHQTARRAFEYARLMHHLQDVGRLDPQLEYLPSDEELQDRRANQQSFTPPELAVLTSYVKGGLKEDLAKSELLDEPYLMREMEVAFPASLIKKYGDELQSHRLRREIVATQIANGLVNRMGINFVHRMSESVGVDSAVIAKAYVGARDIFGVDHLWDEIQLLDHEVEPAIQHEMMLDLIRLLRRTTRWLLRNRRHSLVLENEVPVFQQALQTLFRRWSDLVRGAVLTEWQADTRRLVDAGVGESLASFVAAAHHLYSVLGIVEASNRTGQPSQRAASVYFAVGEYLQLHWFSRQIHNSQATTLWEALARETLQDDLNWQQVAITLGVIAEGSKRASVDTMITDWIGNHQVLVDRWMSLQADMRASAVTDQAIFTVAIRELLDLAQASSSARARF